MSDSNGVFISYRRSDSRADAGRLYDRLAARLGPDRVFMDIDDIGPGQNFREVLRSTLGSSRALLVLIGPGWLDAVDGEGERRLPQRDDVVRLEVATALERAIPVIPVLLNRAAMPAGDRLPEELRPLADRQALELSDSRFHQDAARLIAVLEPLLGPRGAGPERWRLRITASAILLLALASIGLLVFSVREQRPEQNVVESRLSLRASPALLHESELSAALLRYGLFDADRNPGAAGNRSAWEVRHPGGKLVAADLATGLHWQVEGLGTQRQYTAAEAQVREMNRSAYAGFSDWRLPTAEEAISTLVPEAGGGARQSVLLRPRAAPVMWTADRVGDGGHWVVYAFDGTAGVVQPRFNAWVRAVRSEAAQAASRP